MSPAGVGFCHAGRRERSQLCHVCSAELRFNAPSACTAPARQPPLRSVLLCSLLQNFDEVLVPADHVSRSPNDTYYVDPDTVLRCHTSAHQAEMLRRGETAFLVTGDVYRCGGLGDGGWDAGLLTQGEGEMWVWGLGPWLVGCWASIWAGSPGGWDGTVGMR